jgi:hypothetical protein
MHPHRDPRQADHRGPEEEQPAKPGRPQPSPTTASRAARECVSCGKECGRCSVDPRPIPSAGGGEWRT